MEYEPLNEELKKKGFRCFDSLFIISIKSAEEDLEQKYGKRIILRVINYPTTHMLRYLDKDNVGELITTTALIKSVTELRLKLVTAVYSCKKCGHFHEVDEEGERTTLPKVCKACGSRMGFNLVYEESSYDNYKYLSLEEPLELRVGGDSREFKAKVKGYLASPYYTLKAGDVCDVVGELKVEFNDKTKGLDLFVDTWHIKPVNNAYEEIKLYEEDIEKILRLSKDENIFQLLVDSIAPDVYGYDYIKEGLVLQMFEGNRPKDGNVYNNERYLIHILLIGDPGIGKSKLIESIYENSPKAIKSNGAGATAVGIIGGVKKNELTGAFEMSSGAIVLGDGGLLTIDEFDKLSKDVMKALNEPMEQLSVSIAKAGLVQTMTARTSVLAGANPKYSVFVPTRSLEEQLDIPQSTISRFDLIYVMNDDIDYDADLDKARKVLSHDFKRKTDVLDKDTLKKYINYAKNNIFPTLSDDAREYISRFYAKTRQLSKISDDTGKPITLRELGAINRLSIARAKVELRDTVTVEDTKEAIRIYSKSLEGLGLDFHNVGELQNIYSKLELEILTFAEESIEEVLSEYGRISKNEKDNILINLKTEFEYDMGKIKKIYSNAYQNVIEKRK